MSGQMFRLEDGGRIDRSRPVSFRFDGRTYQGFAGDTLASALLANGVHMVARSFKYHRPRGLLGAGPEDPAGLVQVYPGSARTEPNMRATEVEIHDGLEAVSQNRWPSLGFDVGAINDAFARFLPAGFYYKTFMGPPWSWMMLEGVIRSSAGLGVSPRAPDPDRYEHVNRHCDVLVIGAGPAGLSAAREAARAGARVILAEDSAEPGGRLLCEDGRDYAPAGVSGPEWASLAAAELESAGDVTVLTRTCAFGYYGQNWVALAQNVQDHLAPGERDPALPRHRLWQVRARQVVLAAGANERPLVFHSNDRPGVMLASAVRTYLHRYAVTPGRRAIIFANNSSAWSTAFDLVEAGVEVAAIIDVRAEPETAVLERAAALSIPVRTGSAVIATAGRKRIRSVTVSALGPEGGLTGARETIECDLLAVSGGWSPNAALFSQSRGKMAYDEELAAFRPAQSWQSERSAGAANGVFSLQGCIEEGRRAGAEAACATGFKPEAGDVPSCQVPAFREAYGVAACWELPSGVSAARTRAFVDLQNDVTSKDLRLAVREGYRSVEHAKRYTTLGMGTDQGKTSSVNGFGVLSLAMDRSMPEVGVTTYRPPYKPVSFGVVAGQHAGELFHPRRTTPMHACHEKAGAVFETVGDWLRARVYPQAGENFEDALQRESRAARTGIGVLDASTLGKIDIRGPDAREFLNRVYTNAWLKLQPGRCRYGLMLNEDGMVFDDGVTACLADDHFHMTTTTGGAAGVLTWLEDYLQTEWPGLKVWLTSVTEQWAVVSICGPKSPALAAALFDDIETGPEDFPFMSWREGRISGVPARIFRISFTGEISYEINVPARYGQWLWETVMEAGAPLGVTAYGTEAMHLLRAEAGFIIAGQDTDGTVTPHDLGMSWAVKSNADFIGARSLSRPDTARTDRRQLVGLLTSNPKQVIAEGSQVLASGQETRPRTPMIGHVTSSYFSPNLNRSIAFALIEGGLSRMGETVHIARKGKSPARAMITQPNFLAAHKEGA